MSDPSEGRKAKNTTDKLDKYYSEVFMFRFSTKMTLFIPVMLEQDCFSFTNCTCLSFTKGGQTVFLPFHYFFGQYMLIFK